MEAVKQTIQEGVEKLNISGKPQQGQQQQGVKKEKKKVDKKGGAAGSDELAPAPAYFDHRIKIFEDLKKKYDEAVAQKPRDDIIITLESGDTRVGKAWETSPADIAR